ncbi:diguanylate cyclase [Duganella sp. SAP-35]|uniref:Diguanylate cyclase n=2 Tax=Duganella aceris TaxID=2703883 RepID=A0ABX0FJL0_9BURK|nr:diguanylate cyclase [Duganella aceris]
MSTDQPARPDAPPAAVMPGLAQQPLLAKALATTGSPAFIADYRGQIVWVNQAFVALSGYAESELLGMPASILRDGKRDPGHYAQAWRTVQRGHELRNEVVDAHRNGTPYTVEEIITPLCDEHGVITHFFVIRHDVTQRSQRSEHIQHLADHDELTGLLNRTKFRRELSAAIVQAGLNQQLLATLFVDLDHFKPVNDTLGHHVGDLLLETVANRLRGAVRNGDVIARCGGDEFAVLLKEMPDALMAVSLANKLLAALARPFILQHHKVQVSASIGVAIYPQDGADARTLLIKADRAMYDVKHNGGNGVRTCPHC